MYEEYENELLALNNLYNSIPPTRCLKTECSNWCCSRLPSAVNKEGNFISLPLIYSIEYINIKKFVYEHFSKEEIKEFFNYDNKKRLCCFKDINSPNCKIYPVRPFTCRVFGRKVPPIFWGIEYPPEAVDNIYCENCEVVDKNKEKEFIDKFPSYWQILAGLSVRVSVFDREKLNRMNKVAGVNNIFILGWKEFALLDNASIEWIEKEFSRFWEIHKKLL